MSLIHVPKSRIVVLGNIPLLPTSGPQCLSRQPDNVQACSGPVSPLLAPFNKAEQMAATEEGAHYVSVTPWFCSSTCTAVVGNYEVYWDRYHITAAYAFFLGGVLAESLPLPHASGFTLVPRPTTTVLVPANGTALSGRRPLDASATANVASVRFEVTGGTLRHHVIAGSKLTEAGWIVTGTRRPSPTAPTCCRASPPTSKTPALRVPPSRSPSRHNPPCYADTTTESSSCLILPEFQR